MGSIILGYRFDWLPTRALRYRGLSLQAMSVDVCVPVLETVWLCCASVARAQLHGLQPGSTACNAAVESQGLVYKTT
jgi:hypothetical protein